MQFPSFRQPYVLLEPKLNRFRQIHSVADQNGKARVVVKYQCTGRVDNIYNVPLLTIPVQGFLEYTRSCINWVSTGDSAETLVYDILQLNILH
ncbi:hypothetical protein T265_05616 [Opisthorchis viverrini]|uniref:Uncharacterized protein n=1 Tax=Opisthorchis viverrini TaxID=6198 RepID=A0A074ZJU7_OPIVI|nr:hypothetical protein T265_05616 [Opisthorchis viverrini]KER27291.1 hypothetical protein T265_05616 [Opisthorchis viverrini]